MNRGFGFFMAAVFIPAFVPGLFKKFCAYVTGCVASISKPVKEEKPQQNAAMEPHSRRAVKKSLRFGFCGIKQLLLARRWADTGCRYGRPGRIWL